MNHQNIEKSPRWLKIKPQNRNVSEQIAIKHNVQKKPKWLRVKLPTGKNYKHVRKLVSDGIMGVRALIKNSQLLLGLFLF